MKTTLTLALFALAASSLAVPTQAPADTADPIDTAVESAGRAFIENGQTVGLSIGIYKEGKSTTYHFGSTERGKLHPPTDRTIYCIGSITKTFTGLLLAQAVVEKKVSLDDDVRKYLKGEYPNLEYQGHPVRLWQMLNHTSGLPNSLPEKAPWMTGQEALDKDVAKRSAREALFLERYTREDFLRDLRSVKLTRVPGEKFSYSNAAAQLMGVVLEQVYGKSYEELIRSKVAGPLGMKDTRVTVPPADTARFPMGYSAGGPFRPALPTRLPAAGALKSTVPDMLKYIAWNLAEKDGAVRLSHQPAGTTVWSGDNSFTVGLNWQIFHPSGRRIIFQYGTVPGFNSACILHPELRLGIVILTNEEDRGRPASLSPLVEQIMKAIDPRAVAPP